MSKPFQLLTQKLGKLIGYGVLILVVLMGLSVVRNVSRVMAIKREVQAEKARLTKIEKENKELEVQISKTQSPDFVEKQVRDKLGLVKEGETEVVLPDADTLRKLAPKIAQEEDMLPDPIWKRWLKLFI